MCEQKAFLILSCTTHQLKFGKSKTNYVFIPIWNNLNLTLMWPWSCTPLNHNIITCNYLLLAWDPAGVFRNIGQYKISSIFSLSLPGIWRLGQEWCVELGAKRVKMRAKSCISWPWPAKFRLEPLVTSNDYITHLYATITKLDIDNNKWWLIWSTRWLIYLILAPCDLENDLWPWKTHQIINYIISIYSLGPN